MTITIETLVNLSACAYDDGQDDLGNDIISLASRLPTKSNTVIEFLNRELGNKYPLPVHDPEIDEMDTVIPFPVRQRAYRMAY